ncbi:Uncharacterized protein Adt_38606 [Abeliophyllum distichum]|uniref:Uncharacterized protein n=1 Tax=Abeliophyllum distichum TaxID=126358 RepID=A0ABD1Q2V9_9LAMI
MEGYIRTEYELGCFARLPKSHDICSVQFGPMQYQFSSAKIMVAYYHRITSPSTSEKSTWPSPHHKCTKRKMPYFNRVNSPSLRCCVFEEKVLFPVLWVQLKEFLLPIRSLKAPEGLKLNQNGNVIGGTSGCGRV